ncbi:Spi family protease inhibitor, partial [Tannerella forsythia]|uniref:Spi family protease inhibitor n=1 Tax=Tannerella forsythia TaxID=28112 RepID=UPI0028EA1A53
IFFAKIIISGQIYGYSFKLKSGEINTILSSSTHTIKALDSINLYVFNYKKGGFVIINPIKRHSSRILAFSEKDNLPIEKLNSGVLSLWKDYTMECLLKQEIADKNAPKLRSLINRPFPEYIKKLLKIKVGSLTESQRREILNYLHDTDVTKVFAEPIIKTNWHQDFPYNDNCPHHYPAGCVAISVGQILNHYRKWDGESWNWDKVNRSEKPEISRFVRTVGSGVKMTYHKGGSYPDWANLNFITDLNYREVTFLKKIGSVLNRVGNP